MTEPTDNDCYTAESQRGFIIGYNAALRKVFDAIMREMNYREYRKDQDGSAVGACKSLAQYVGAMKK